MSLVVAHIVWLASRSFADDPHRRSLLAVGATVILLFFAHFAGMASWLAEHVPGAGPIIVGVVLAAVAMGVAMAVACSSREVKGAVRFLNVTAVLLVGYTAVRAGLPMVGGPPPEPEPRAPQPQPGIGATDPGTPDVFFIILDAYTGPTSLQDV